ncbi:transcriptional regulator LytR [Gottschalkia purinilytica]|uniref:Transcriptional regulator LytR n=1 Tax=Gottschalkia purinilytica TaxID=1503 RepID=A0A0L0WD90_GOTPU|nr:LCP family protein [Gottschalkia purinilytica]KNF09432.1 transcriptional regulator LytR [Gottschalkia purinilytica]
MGRFLKTFFTSLLIFSVILGGGIFFAVKSDKIGNKASGNDIDSGKTEGKDSNEIKFLLMGVDAETKGKSEGQRTDTMMLCKYDATSGKISILSIPRDTKVKIKGKKSEDKINHAHAFGGPELTVKTVRDLLGIDLDYYVKVDYEIVKDVVDEIGGVEIDVPINMKYSDPVADPPLHINIKKGKQVLNGKKSLEFLRFRKGYADQDLGRINAQQQFIKNAIDQTLKPKNIVKIPSLIKTSMENIETNIPLKLMLKYGLDVKNIDTSNIEMATLPGEAKMIENVSYFIPDEDESEEIVKSMFEDHKVVNKKTSQE